MSFKSDLDEVNSRLADLESRARKLRNQHLADLIGHTIGRLGDAAKHPDVDNVDRVKDGEEPQAPAPAPLNSGGNLLFAAGDPGARLQAEEAARRDAFGHDAANRDPATGQPLQMPYGGGNPADPNAPFPDASQSIDPNAPWTPPGTAAGGTAAGGTPVSSSDPNAHHPGDPEFLATGTGAMAPNPNDVNLNADGTLKQAPGVKGASDDRDKA